ncbi:MAG: polymerase subunit alpha [Chlamydiota bacterium]|jgi:DNA polymerase-3 subunit alpha
MDWVPLHLYSQYSILEATASIEDLVEKAKEEGLSHLALTDRGNMYGAVEFAKACKSAHIHPIIGAEFFVAPGSRFEKKKVPGQPHGFSLVLLAKNTQGYKNLSILSSKAHLEGFYWTPRIDKELLASHAGGLICLAGSLESIFTQPIDLSQEVEWFQSIFGADFYLEIMRHYSNGLELNEENWLTELHKKKAAEEKKLNDTLIHLAKEKNIDLVAVNASRYLKKEGWRAHEIAMNVQSGEPVEIWEKDSYGNPKNKILNPKRLVCPTHELYFKSKEEMYSLFSDLQDALANTVKVAEKCVFEFDFKTKHYPLFIPPHLEGTSFTREEREKEAEHFLRSLCQEGIKHRYTQELLLKVQEKYPGKDPSAVIKERLEYELSVILPKGMGDYLLIVWDFINWAKRQGIPMGPGRGSGAGSIILYLIGITDIEPLRFNLFFERFINPERLSYPDIDVDICMDRRAEVIDYTVKKYGKERVAQIITFGTMKAKMAIKDVGRMLSIPLTRVNQIAKLIPEDPNMTIDEALKIDPEFSTLYTQDEDVKRWIDLSKELEGSVRNTGIHAAGMIISGESIAELCPICHAKDSQIAVTQYSMKPVEAIGMLKIDFLGLKTLTSIQHAVNAIEKSQGKLIDWINLPLDDAPTFQLLNQGKTAGIFQLESGGMQDLAKQLHLDNFEELIAVVSLYRPGPMEMIPSFVQRKHKKEQIEIDHPLMEEILSETYGIMVYQEQVMAIASKLAGYSLGEGDVLRRAMGKKDREEMAKQREKFRLGALAKGIDEKTSMTIFDKIEKFASYGFNKSHAAAYGYLSYATAYLKANYTPEWLAALMTSDRDDLSKVAKHMYEARHFQIDILPPDVNESGQEFVATPKGIRFAMGGIKGIGTGVVDAILQERNSKGFFVSLYDFVSRIDTQKVGKKTIEHLIEAGCFDFTKQSRIELLVTLEPMYDKLSKEQKESSKGILSLFSLLDTNPAHAFDLKSSQIPTVSRQQVLKREYELLGIYLNEHPLDEFRPLFQQLSCVPLSELDNLAPAAVFRTAFIIEGIVIKISNKTQRKFAILKISDGITHYELPIWSDLYEQKGSLIVENQLIYAILQKEMVEGEVKLQCRWMADLNLPIESMISDCDAAYEIAKTQLKKIQMRTSMEKTNPPPVKEKKIVCNVLLDAEKATLSDILALKKLFSSHSGSTPVTILFDREGPKQTLKIDANWGITLSETFEKKIKALPCIKGFETA